MIRAIQPTDRESWERLFLAYGDFYETEFSRDVLDRVWAILQDDSSGLHALVAEHDGGVVGLAHYRFHRDTFSGGWDWFLDDLYVDPAARGAGAATELIAAIVTRAREKGDAGTLRWITAADNDRAQRVYDRIATKATWVTYEIRP